jgi:polyisoprenoid-binding protein YceI
MTTRQREYCDVTFSRGEVHFQQQQNRQLFRHIFELPFDGHLTSSNWFDADIYPNITFKSNQFKFKGDKPTEVIGELTVRGITKPVTLRVTHFHCAMHPMRQIEACGANAVTHIKRSEFGLGKYAPNVSDEVELTIAVEAVKE